MAIRKVDGDGGSEYTTCMEMPLSEILDRYSILLLKKKRLPEDDTINAECARFKVEVDAYADQSYIQEQLQTLVTVNGKIWDLESDIRKGKEGELGLEEVGRRALSIRDLNAERIKNKNVVAQKLGEFKEIKIDHASA